MENLQNKIYKNNLHNNENLNKLVEILQNLLNKIKANLNKI